MQHLFLLLLTLFLSAGAIAPGTTPAVGDKAPDFTLTNLQGAKVRLSDVAAKGPVALIALRGYPGYQ
ncbi:MAG: redoxin domain-containing protein [Blastocatellia bacterium]|nr:redoxin domain-containing protein [Blastocatellia bacterium]